MTRTLLLGLVLSIAATGAFAEEGRAVYGAGTFSCGRWQEVRTSNSKTRQPAFSCKRGSLDPVRPEAQIKSSEGYLCVPKT